MQGSAPVASVAMAEKSLRLSAEDCQDLTVISACLQDAVTRRSAITYQRAQRRFAAVFNRFQWESETAPAAGTASARRHSGTRVRTGIHFEGVLQVQTRGLQTRQDAVMELLAIRCEPGADATATVILDFAGGGAIRLEVECIDCYLSDLGRSWQALRRPTHEQSDEGRGGDDGRGDEN